MYTSILVGPIHQLLPMNNFPLKGALKDSELPIVSDAGILIEDGTIKAVGSFEQLRKDIDPSRTDLYGLEGKFVGLPGIIDAHTHSCFAGSRAKDYALRNSGKSYLEIASEGGGIWSTVQHTRKAKEEQLFFDLKKRLNRFLKMGNTTVEIKSGYGLSVEDELKMLRVIRRVQEQSDQGIVSTCLAAHTLPKDFSGNHSDYLQHMVTELFPILKREKLTSRIDAFVEKSAFTVDVTRPYLHKAREMGFQITLHADQFTTGGSALAIECGAVSADHLEASGSIEIERLAKSNTIATALPGASLGLGEPFAPARQLLDAGACLVIASDYNPGSAPMGNLITEAAILGTFQKLSNAEIFAAITFRAAAALSLADRGILAPGKRADFILYPVSDYNEILYHQGQLIPDQVWINGKKTNTES